MTKMSEIKANTIINKSKKRKRSISIKINADGTILVSAPLKTKESEIENLLKEKQKWINKHLNNRKNNAHYANTKETLYFLGQNYPIKLQTSQLISKTGFIEFNNTEFTIITPNNNTDTDIKKAINNWYKNQAKDIIPKRCQYWKDIMNVNHGKITLKQTSQTWGSCCPKNNLMFNFNIIRYHYDIIDYLIVHELAHIKEKNHSRAFWKVVENYIPDYQKRRDILKQLPLT